MQGMTVLKLLKHTLQVIYICSAGILKTWNYNFFKLVNFSNMSNKKFPIKITQKVLLFTTDV